MTGPDEYGEDLAGNFRDIATLAHRFCTDCADYHIAFVSGRLVNPVSGIDGDRDRMVAILRRLLAGRAGREGDIELVIAGSADTGVLATCAHAAALAGPEIAARIRYTVLDRCGTPLELCRRYAARNGLTLRTETVDLLAAPVDLKVDIAVAHSLLRFIPTERQPGIVAMFARWLTPDGRLLLTHGLRSPGEPHRGPKTAARLIRLLEEGRISPPEPHDAFLARLRRRAALKQVARTEFSTEQGLLDLLASSPLTALEVKTVRQETIADGETIVRRRAVVVAGLRST